MNSSYITSAQQAQQLPDLGGHPEVAFVGRSNCGKSSLLNALLGRTGLARASKTPGRTQMVNFFAVDKGEARMIFADLPGYGFSAIGKDVRHHWQDLVDAYLRRHWIKEMLFLIDARRASDLDSEDLRLLLYLARRQPSVPVTVVLTKMDKATQRELSLATAKVNEELTKAKAKVERILPVSSLKRKGIDGLRDRILKHLEPDAAGSTDVPS